MRQSRESLETAQSTLRASFLDFFLADLIVTFGAETTIVHFPKLLLSEK
jgi:hypothetical protein